MSMTELPEPDETEELQDPEALAAELNLGLDLSEDEQAEAEAMVRHLEEQFGGPIAEGEPEPEQEPDEPPEPAEPEPAEPQVAQPVAANTVVIDGVAIPVEEAVKYLVEREKTKATPAPVAAEPPKPPEWLDQEDPAQVAMWQRLDQLERQQAQVAGNQQQIAQQQAVTRAQADAESGINTFRTLHPELSEDDIMSLRTHAVALDIIDGLARTRSGSDAIVKALDIAYWDHPEFRARATAEPTPKEAKQAKATERKGKLNALAGGSGSAPRQEARPDLSTDGAAKKAAAQWLKEQNIL